MPWITTNIQNDLPKKAVLAGREGDDALIYVGRAWHNNELFPAKVIPSKKFVSISLNGSEIIKDNYDILTGGGFTWVSAQNGEVPDGSVQGGKMSDGSIIYIGRAELEGSTVPGKIVPNQHCMFVPFQGAEIKFLQYETLVKGGCGDACGCAVQ